MLHTYPATHASYSFLLDVWYHGTSNDPGAATTTFDILEATAIQSADIFGPPLP